jgi:hypothetical protein
MCFSRDTGNMERIRSNRYIGGYYAFKSREITENN